MVRAAFRLYRNFGLPGAGLILALEGIGVPIPVEIPLGIIGLRMAQGYNTYWQMVWLMCLASMFGNTIGYVIGYYGGRPLALKLIGWFRINPDHWYKVENWFRVHGLKLVVATRWINWGFAQNMWLCGITRVPFWKFFAVMAINDFLWAMGWTWVALKAMAFVHRSHRLEFLHHSTIRVGLAVLALVVVGVGTWFLIRWVRKRRALNKHT